MLSFIVYDDEIYSSVYFDFNLKVGCFLCHNSNLFLISFCFISQVFLVNPPIHVSGGDDLDVSFSMNRSKQNHRLMEIELSCQIKQSSGVLLPPFTNRFYVE